MSNIVAVTNRRLVCGDFLTQIEKITAMGISTVILREKDIADEAYVSLAEKVIALCEAHGAECILHNHTSVAKRIGCKKLHLPIAVLKKNQYLTDKFSVGVSIHSVFEALLAEKLGAKYAVCGHIFQTNCKRDLKPRGTDFLAEVCASVKLPIYAIGGISFDNMHEAFEAGAAKVCMMSELMKL